ncbi:ABC transporter permease [Streptosporangiaceae bacterium NEAU-GS5]|nr:ABC transporter permease [Streptosporangiaceae bacterium NEAU-GS5]
MRGRTPLVLRRALSEPLLLAASLGSILLATTTLVALTMYAVTVAEVGVRRAMETAPIAITAATVTSPVTADTLQNVDTAVRTHVKQAYQGLPATVLRTIRSDSYAMPGQQKRERPDLTKFATYEKLENRTRLTAGAWPRPGEPVQVALTEAAARAMNLHLGDAFTVVGRLTHKPVQATVSGLFELPDPYSDQWRGDELLLRGLETRDYTTYGPLVVNPQTFEERFATNVSAAWQAVPDLRGLPRDRLRSFADSVSTLGDRLHGDCSTCTSFTRLPDMLGQLDQAALVARSTMLVPVLQLLLLAAYALTLTARLLADHRRMEVALLRSRGAGGPRLALLAGGEALLVAVPSAIVAPLLAPWLLRGINTIPWIQAAGVRLDPAPDGTAYLVSCLVALACAVLLALPALRGARRTYIEEQAARGRGDRQGLIQRMGADLALLAVAALAIWQLGHYGGPVTATAAGGLGVDPLIVTGPALALLCGGMLGLRLVPLVSGLAERVLGRRRSLAPALGAWQVSRRPLRYAGPALLLTMAIAIGVVSMATAATWRASQEDQARHQAGADLRVGGPLDSPELGVLGRGARLAALPGVTRVAPVVRANTDLAGADATLLAADADRLDGLLLLRRDLAPDSVAVLARKLAAARPSGRPMPVPGTPRTLTWQVSLTPVEGAVRLSAIVRDALGASREFVIGPLVADGRTHAYTTDIAALAGRSGKVAYPLAVQAMLFDMPNPAPFTLRVGGLESWTAKPDRAHPVELNGSTVTFSDDKSEQDMRLALLPPGSGADHPLPVIITADLAKRADLKVGSAVDVSLGGVPTPIVPVAILPAMPGTTAGEPAVLTDLVTLTARDLASGRPPRTVTEWWLATRGGDTAPAAAELARHREWDQTVVDRAALTRQLRDDPLAGGLQGALVLGFLAALVFALLGFLVNAAVAARERTAEFALLRALGVSHRQVFGLLAVEQAFIVALSLAAGTALAVTVAVLVVPHIVLTGQATAVTPGVLLDIPWGATAALLVGVGVALFAIVAGLARQLRRQGLGRALRIGED